MAEPAALMFDEVEKAPERRSRIGWQRQMTAGVGASLEEKDDLVDQQGAGLEDPPGDGKIEEHPDAGHRGQPGRPPGLARAQRGPGRGPVRGAPVARAVSPAQFGSYSLVLTFVTLVLAPPDRVDFESAMPREVVFVVDVFDLGMVAT